LKESNAMKGMTVRLPVEYEPRLAALARKIGVKPAEFARQKLIQAIEQEERARHEAGMQEMVRQAIAFGEIRDQSLEEAALEAINRQQS
jgi:predicted DNA-binding protein